MSTWDESFIQTLITEPNILKSGEKLARSSVWSEAGTNSISAWALVQGSEKLPYQVCIDLGDTATKCSCPSRKIPCKHVAGLMLLLARGSLPTIDTPPAWVGKWLSGRQNKREAIPSSVPKPVDSAAQAKREAARIAKVTAGIEEIRLFLEDLMRRGISDPIVKSYSFWDRIAARMIDAQIQPFARRLRALGGLPFQKKKDWVSSLIHEVAQMYALTEAFLRIESLPEPLSHDIRTALGFSLKQDEVLASGTILEDRWQILGVQLEEMESLKERRTWLYGETMQRYALVLDYTHPSRPFDEFYPLGHSFTGGLVYYPSAYPQRAIVKDRYTQFIQITDTSIKFNQSVDSILENYTDALSHNPFVKYIPAGLQQGWITRDYLLDRNAMRLPLGRKTHPIWLNAVSGDHWMPVFGEWNGAVFQIASFIATDGWTELGDI